MPAPSRPRVQPAFPLDLDQLDVWRSQHVRLYLNWSRSKVARAQWLGLLNPTRDGRQLAYDPREVKALASKILRDGFPVWPQSREACRAMAANG